MKPSMKMGVIVLIGVFVVFYQYHLSTGIRFDQIADLNAADAVDSADSPEENPVFSREDVESYVRTSKSKEEMIRNAVRSVQKTNGLSPDVAASLIQELIDRFNKNAFDDAGNNSSSRVSRISKISATSQARTSLDRHRQEPVDPLYIITPTYRRPEQIPELTRMSHTLMLVKNVHWLVIEDATVATKQVTELLERTGLKFDHLTAPMPEKYKQKKGAKPRGVSNRNRGLQWIRANATDGVFYFADDDNTYDVALFDEVPDLFSFAIARRTEGNVCLGNDDSDDRSLGLNIRTGERSRFVARIGLVVQSTITRVQSTDPSDEQGLDVPRRSVHEIRLELAGDQERKVRWVLRRLDSRQKVPRRYGRVRGEREIPPSEAERHHAVQGWLRGGRISEKPRAVRAQGHRVPGRQLHQDPRVAHANQKERGQRASRHEALQRNQPRQIKGTDCVICARNKLIQCLK
ncbi:glucuronyltransferase P isoform X1 [Nomia melanderi]|uniref:glucuronyltransferase P isoform X1 n=1 Tax=Nomia melanderi TaxID=2448451 RepID=UPI00130448AD|nr:uncharacterized protein LOC116434761 isoform X1 [Nomia melanderi]